MNTPSHWLLHAAIAQRAARSSGRPDGAPAARRPARAWRRAFVWGAVAPDLLLTLLVLLGAVWFVPIRGMGAADAAALMFDRLYFEHPLWISAYNLLHAPAVLLVLWGAGRLRGDGPVGSALRGFALGCLLHTAFDIPLHHDDGPLLLWPFEWSVRFRSPVSYWDPDYYGRWVGALELILDATLLALLVRGWRRERRARRGRR